VTAKSTMKVKVKIIVASQ